jgi:hypothetical protein
MKESVVSLGQPGQERHDGQPAPGLKSAFFHMFFNLKGLCHEVNNLFEGLKNHCTYRNDTMGSRPLRAVYRFYT